MISPHIEVRVLSQLSGKKIIPKRSRTTPIKMNYSLVDTRNIIKTSLLIDSIS